MNQISRRSYISWFVSALCVLIGIILLRQTYGPPAAGSPPTTTAVPDLRTITPAVSDTPAEPLVTQEVLSTPPPLVTETSVATIPADATPTTIPLGPTAAPTIAPPPVDPAYPAPVPTIVEPTAYPAP